MKFMERARSTGAGAWQKISAGQSYKIWCGFAFEAVCQKHVPQMMKALGITNVHTEASGWRYTSKKKGVKGAQVDLLLDGNDRCINLCEMKFSTEEFVIDKKYANELDQKITVFNELTKTRKSIFPTMVTTYGVKRNEFYTQRVQAEITMKDLFANV